jgi:ABC-type glycerol-3-phosphate transport system substrate-binding protein
MLPENGWSIETFVDALRLLKQASPDGSTPFIPQDGSNIYILLLTAAYGGLPVDFSTNPITTNLTDPANVDALRQVLDLSDQGYMDYQALGDFGGGGYGGGAPIVSDIVYRQLETQFRNPLSKGMPAQMAPYPSGSHHAAHSMWGRRISARIQ